MQATRAGAPLPILLLATLCMLAAGQLTDPTASCAADDCHASAGIAMITSGMKVVPGMAGLMEDPFADLSDASDEALLEADEGRGPLRGPAEAAEAAEAAEVAEAPGVKAAAPLGDAAARAHKLLRSLAPSAFAVLLVVASGISVSFFMDSVLHKAGNQLGKKELFDDPPVGTSQGGEAGRKVPPPEPAAATTPGGGGEEGEDDEDDYGCTALHCAADRGAAAEVRALLAQGAGVNRREAWNETPLHFAARSGSAEVCELLLTHGAELNPVNESDCTPLLVAAKAGKEDVCKLLLGRGAHAGGATDAELPPLLSVLLLERIFTEAAVTAGPAVRDAAE